GPVRRGRRRVARDSCARHRTRPRDAWEQAGSLGRKSMTETREEEEGMSKYLSRRSRRLLPLIGLSLAVVAVAAAGGAAAGGKSCGTVTLNEQAWAGSTANTYVAKYVLEHKLGCTVKITQITEVPVYQAMADGKTDAVLEDWGHLTQQK